MYSHWLEVRGATYDLLNLKKEMLSKAKAGEGGGRNISIWNSNKSFAQIIWTIYSPIKKFSFTDWTTNSLGRSYFLKQINYSLKKTNHSSQELSKKTCLFEKITNLFQQMAVSCGWIAQLSKEKSTRLDHETYRSEQITYSNINLFARIRYLFARTHSQSIWEKNP